MSYRDKLKDPRWQKKRLLILQRDNFSCTCCGDDKNTLHVHHMAYHGDPWNTPDHLLITLCETCHEMDHAVRPAAEQRLLQALREKKMMGYHIELIAEGIEFMEPFHVEDVMASTLKWMFTQPDLLKELGQKYLSSLSKKH